MTEQLHYQVAVIGGGISGVCAALAAARHGAKTVLIQDRPVLGGNASSEIRMHIAGANREGTRENARETGIIEEILLENQLKNPQHSFSVSDTILWEKVRFQENLSFFLNTRVTKMTAENGKIISATAQQMTTERDLLFTADQWIDATGDGIVAHQAGAKSMRGREAAAEYGESLAPAVADDFTMGNSILFTAKDMGRPVPFQPPEWAYHYDDKDIPGHAHHNNGTVVEATSGYWWLELGGDARNSVMDGEDIRDELLKTLYGVWDHLKNQDKGCDNLALDWVGFLPGKRESRRVLGDYVLRQDDLTSGRIFLDDIAYGGWHIDLHPVGGFAAFGDFKETSQEVLDLKLIKSIYGLPYRCLLPVGMDNLIMAGRAISATHVAFGSTRVMGTCALVGQAAGTAAAMAAKAGTTPREVDVAALQALLLRDDCYLPGKCLKTEENIRVECSSEQPGYEAAQAVNGFLRAENGQSNCWHAAAGDDAPWLEAIFEKEKQAREVILRFDSNCSRNYTVSISSWTQQRTYQGVPEELVKDYTVELLLRGKTVWQKEVRGNYQRFTRHMLPDAVVCDAVRMTAHAPFARVFQMEVYE